MKHNATMALVWQSHRAWACRTNPTKPPPPFELVRLAPLDIASWGLGLRPSIYLLFEQKTFRE
ncbi:hypothetical protein CPAR01_16767 [Colletotrichum paranaense]|uniref:Uncharacterized protein n=1 Tax=Colletotrichum paranaense TaxID=1914294 RepID=A0ABQ9RV61_9PEZI|nr:uncharacterized protein CPAR01_16767 [Colletotrichum paranaense]KAK1515385.1 hypothetical protein CPAR01_16767 [Colletotrichum paranaense]